MRGIAPNVFLFLCVFALPCLLVGQDREILSNEFTIRDGLIYAGEEERPYTGLVMYRYDDKKPKMVHSYQAGVLHGKVTLWYPNGKKQNETNYVAGKKEGEFRAWHRNGQLEWEGSYVDGRESGVWVRYDSSGVLISEQKYDPKPAEKKSGFVLKPPRPPAG